MTAEDIWQQARGMGPIPGAVLGAIEEMIAVHDAKNFAQGLREPARFPQGAHAWSVTMARHEAGSWLEKEYGLSKEELGAALDGARMDRDYDIHKEPAPHTEVLFVVIAACSLGVERPACAPEVMVDELRAMTRERIRSRGIAGTTLRIGRSLLAG